MRLSAGRRGISGAWLCHALGFGFGLGLTVTQRITYKWDVLGRSSWQSLAYRNVTSAIDLAERTDHSWQLGAGVGYRVGEVLRIGLDGNYFRRDAPDAEYRNYDGLRIGASFSYGLPQ